MWIIVRLCGIVIGIATLLRVATNEKLVTYDPLFLAWMDWLSDIVELGFLTKLIGPFLHWGIDWVRSFGISVPDLQDEWRPTFVLSMLMFGAISRHSRSWWLLLFAPVGALTFAVWSGLVGSLAPVGGAVGVGVGFALFTSFGPLWQRSAVALGSFTTAIAGSVFAATFGAPAAVQAVALLALLFLAAGIVESWGEGLQALFANRFSSIGIDILGVMLGALGFASFFANPPIW